MRLFLSVISLVLGQTLLFAQTNPPMKLTLEDAVQIAIDNNSSLQKIRNSVAVAQADYLTTVGKFLPNLNASIGMGYSEGSRFVDPALPLINTVTRSYNWGLRSSINLFNGLADWKDLNRAELDLDRAKLGFGRQAQTTLLNVSSSYLSVLLNQELLNIARENLRYQDEQLKKISEMSRLGSRPLLDLYNQQYEKANAELSVINAEKNLEISKSQLVNILAMDPTQDYIFETPEVPQTPDDPNLLNLTLLIDEAFKSRPDYKSAELNIKNRETAVWQAWTGYMPSLDLSWSWGASASSPSNIDVFDQLTDQRGYSLNLTLSIPIFNRFQVNYGIQQATVNLQSARLDLSDLEREIKINVKQAYLDYISYKKAYETSLSQFKAADLARQTAQERYNIGAGSFTELTLANSNYTRAASDREQKRFQFEFQRKVLEFYIGSLKTEDYVTIQ